MIDDRWLVSLTISRQSHIQTCLFADDCIMYGPLYEHWHYVVLQQDLDALAEWESKSGMEFHPQKCSVLSVSRSRPPSDPLPQANRTHHEYWRCNKVPGCRLPGYRFLEDTHRKYLQEAQQHAQGLKTKPQVLWWGLKSKYLRQHSQLELWILLVCLDPAQEVSDSEIRDKSKNSCLVHNKPKQEHQQPAINSRASPVGIFRFQALQNSTDTDR